MYKDSHTKTVVVGHLVFLLKSRLTSNATNIKNGSFMGFLGRKSSMELQLDYQAFIFSAVKKTMSDPKTYPPQFS